MAYTPIFSAADLDALSGPHVSQAWFADVQFPEGRRRLHTGMTPVTIGGYEWEGVSDPFGGQMVSLTGMEEPAFGQAVAVDIMFSGANRDFFKACFDTRLTIEGTPCDLYYATFDGETGDVLIGLKKLFPGKLTAPRFSITGTSIRAVSYRVVSPGEGLNFPETNTNWSTAGQRARYPGDKGLDEISNDIIEEFRA